MEDEELEQLQQDIRNETLEKFDCEPKFGDDYFITAYRSAVEELWKHFCDSLKQHNDLKLV